jgi:SAM-dependent methyltransferase
MSVAPSTDKRTLYELFAVSVLVLFLELACIRWFPAHVLLLTFFTNAVLLACFVGMSIGCLVAKRERNYIRWTAPILLVGIVLAHAAELMPRMEKMVDVGDNSQVVYFGADRYADPARFFIPIELLCGVFFVLICVANIGPGQELGRAIDRVPDRVKAYTINIAGSLVGIVLFALSSLLELPPPFWFGSVALLLAFFVFRETKRPLPVNAKLVYGLPLALVVILASWRTGNFSFDRNVPTTVYWSPYYRLDYEHAPSRNISVNLIGHQRMEPLDNIPEYNITHLLNRDMQRLSLKEGEAPKAFQDVLVIGAGSGNDLSRALQFGVGHIDAVDIDPVIQRLGRRDHPAQPYSDPRVTAYNDDGRNFLRSTDKKYDLVVYALVDSLVLHSSFSNIRLESYLFTKEAFEDVQRHLKPNGVFATYNYFRQGWVVGRVEKTLKAAFGTDPLVMMLPYREKVEPDATFGSFTIFLSGSDEALAPFKKAFADNGSYWLDAKNATPAATRNGFLDKPPAVGTGDEAQLKDDQRWMRFGKATIVQPAEELALATDDWPFLYLRKPMIPSLSLRAAAIMGALALALLFWFDRRGQTSPSASPARAEARTPFDLRMFFLGAGFMLVETKAVVRMALLFGSTWMVNSFVFFAVLLVILLANLLVLKMRPKSLSPFYVGLLGALLVSVFVPMEAFLGMARAQQIVLASGLVALPIFFAGVVFAVSFARTTQPDRAFGANIAGAMLGGLAEYASMRVGFQHVGYVAIAFYLLAMLAGRLMERRPAFFGRAEEPRNVPDPAPSEPAVES